MSNVRRLLGLRESELYVITNSAYQHSCYPLLNMASNTILSVYLFFGKPSKIDIDQTMDKKTMIKESSWHFQQGQSYSRTKIKG